MSEPRALRIYPAIDLLDGCVVRLHKGRYDAVTVYSNSPDQVAEGFAAAGAEWLHLVDLSGARDGAPTQASQVTALLDLLPGHVRIQVGGGIRTVAQIEAYLAAGAARVVLGTAAVRDPAFLAKACARYPVVVAVDAVDGMVAVAGWQEVTQVRAADLAVRARDLGARGVLYTDVSRDGTGTGPNVAATAELARAVPEVEVIASGGVGSLDDIAALRAAGGIGGCVVGRALYDRKFSLANALRAAR